MRLGIVLLPLLLSLGCSYVNLDVTPTVTPLKVRLGNKAPETWESLTAKKEELESEFRCTLQRLQSAGYASNAWVGIYPGTGSARQLIKTWPWPIQTQVAKQRKDIGRIEAELVYMNSPTPTRTPTPDPEWTPTPRPTREPYLSYIRYSSDWKTWTPTPSPTPCPLRPQNVP